MSDDEEKNQPKATEEGDATEEGGEERPSFIASEKFDGAKEGYQFQVSEHTPPASERPT